MHRSIRPARLRALALLALPLCLGLATPGTPLPGRTVTATAAGFDWPLRPVPRVARAFQPPSHPYGPGHRGADLVGRAGQPVLAAGPGVVIYAGPLAGRGVVSVLHPNGMRTTYEPVRASIRRGQPVRGGDKLGELEPGHPGCDAAACLHWGLLREHRYLDPLVLVRLAPVRLLPWPDDPGPPGPDQPTGTAMPASSAN
jgi:murein DD-endopeptidase MepM/ murein hydrolase activator NlpD